MKLYVSNADDSFLQEGALNPKIEVLEITDSSVVTMSSRASSTSSQSFSENTIPEVMPNWKPLTEYLRQLEQKQSINEESEKGIIKILFDPKYELVGDNVDTRTKRRHYLIDRSAIDLHFFNLIVVSNRVRIPDKLIGVKAPTLDNVLDVPMTHFLPTTDDEASFREEVKVLVSRELIKYFPELSWMKKFVINHIFHEHSKEAKEKSEVVCICLLLFHIS